MPGESWPCEGGAPGMEQIRCFPEPSPHPPTPPGKIGPIFLPIWPKMGSLFKITSEITGYSLERPI